MCTERDRLIDYVYNECDASQREQMQRHLDTCDECRAEVTSLRSVREDLLAWDVPAHESVWRPFAPAPVTSWWKQVPAWAMAAAAGLVMLSGAAGGAALQAFMPAAPGVAPQLAPVATQAATVAPTPAGLTNADLSAAEQRWLAQLRSEVGALDARVLKASNRAPVTSIDGDHTALVQRISDLQGQNEALTEVIKSIYANSGQVRSEFEFKNAQLLKRVNELQTLVASQLQLQVK